MVSTQPSLRGQGQETTVLLDHHVLTGLQYLVAMLANRGIHIRPGEPRGVPERRPGHPGIHGDVVTFADLVWEAIDVAGE